MDYFTGILQNDVLLLFLTVGLGAIIGKVSFKHVRIGSSGILFAGLILGALGGTVTGQFFSFNLVIFIVAVGLLAARDIVWALKHHGVNFITLGIVVPITSALMVFLLATVYRQIADPVLIAGAYTGAVTSSPGLAAALEMTSGNRLVTLGHSIAYIPGVIVVILFIQLVPRLLRLRVEDERESLLSSTASKSMFEREQPKTRSIVFPLVTFFAIAVAGMLVGSINIPFPFVKGVRLGSTGGALLISLFVGALLHRRNRFPFNPRVLNAIRAMALAFFLAVVGLQAGGGIVAVFQQVGSILILVSIVGALVPAVVALVLGRFVFKMNWILLSGSICGAMTSTPGLGIAIESVHGDEPAVGYGAVYPIALIVVVICTMVLHSIL